MSKFSDVLKNNEELSRQLLISSDYREFLRTFFKIKKNIFPAYSYAVFARQAKVSKSLPRDIIEGLKRVTDKTLPAFAKAMELDGLMEEFFMQLVLSESDPSRKKLVERLKALYLETHFTKSFSDSNFKDFKSPFLYAASGTIESGAKLELLAQRTGLSISVIKESLPQLEKLKLGRYLEEEKTFIPATPQVHVVPQQDTDYFVNFYLFCLNLQKEQVTKKFHSPDALFYNEVFSINEKDLPTIKQEMKKVLKSFLIKAENPQGDSVAVVNLGLFKQHFEHFGVQYLTDG